MKYVAFLRPDEHWDGLDWIYNLMEDSASDKDFFLVDAKTPEVVRDLVAEELYATAMRQGGTEYVVEDAFYRLCSFEFEDESEVWDYFGKKDGKTVFEFFEKYTWDAMFDGKIRFYEEFNRVDREHFYDFDQENLKKLYLEARRYDILVMPITKTLASKGE